MRVSQSKKQLKARRDEATNNARQCRSLLRSRIAQAQAATDSQEQARLLDFIEVLTAELQKQVDERDHIDVELKKMRQQTKRSSGKKKVRKVHNISGREIDPTGFRGVVSGGIPGGGKRR